MRATLATTLLVSASLITAFAALAQTAGDQEKGSTGWSGGSKDQPGQSWHSGAPCRSQHRTRSEGS
jgi:hypothetical protein